MNYVIEKDWITEAGLRAVVLLVRNSHRCGYVAIPKDHPLHGVLYYEKSQHLELPDDEEVGKRGIIPLLTRDPESAGESPGCYFNVHGGLTFSGGDKNYPAESDDLWWFGFDCAHYGDGLMGRSEYEEFPVRSTEYVSSECENLARQLAEINA